ncbi:restriction endonuclease [Priestia filamentosa]|uniref:restriction endonuclease n=1 Tax=Priestia filamentosa TaxID=1402861 RepID=UPI0039824924
MWKFFKRKEKAQYKEPKKPKYEVKKDTFMNKAKAKFNDFSFSYHYTNATLTQVLFVDEQKRKIGIYKSNPGNKYVQSNIYKDGEVHQISFSKLEEISINFGSESVILWSNDEFYVLARDQSVEEILGEFEQKLTPDIPNLSLQIKERSEDLNSHAVSIMFFDKDDISYNFERNVSEIKQVFQILAKHMLDGEIEFLKEKEREQQNKECQELAWRLEYLEKQEPVIEAEWTSLLPDLITSWDFIIDDLRQESNYKYNFDTLQLKGVRENKLFLGYDLDYMKTINSNLIGRLIECIFRTRGWTDIEIISNNVEIEKVPLENNCLMWNKIYNLLIEVAGYRDEQYELEKGRVRTYQNGMLFIDYDGNEIEELREWWKRSHWDFNKLLPSTLFSLLGVNVEVIFVNSTDSIELISLDHIDKLWEVAIQNTSKKVWNDSNREAMELSKVHILQDDTLLVYFPIQYRYNSRIPYSWEPYLLYDLYIHTRKNIYVRVIDNPEPAEREASIPENIMNWINELKAQHKSHFKFMDLRESYDCIIILVDDKLYYHPYSMWNPPTHVDDSEKLPVNSEMMKNSLRIFNDGSSKRIFIGQREYKPNDEFEKGIEEYLTELDITQQRELEEIRQSLNSSKVSELIQRFYIKEIKNRYKPTELLSMFEWEYSFDKTIYPLSNFLKEKGYVLGKNYLIDYEIRNAVKEIIITNISSAFLQNNEESFKNLKDMTLSDCLIACRTLEFFNVGNDDDMISFTLFLLNQNKVSYDYNSYHRHNPKPYHQMVQNVRELINDIVNQDKLDEFEAYLYSDDSSSNQEFTIEMTDVMDGYEFELFIAELFNRMGYTTEITKSSGDCGIDVIARRKGIAIGIQTKRFSNKVPNKAVQEAIAGVSFYNLDKGMVVTNNYFTKQAQNQAIKSNIMLWDRNTLNQKITELYTSGTTL